MDKRKDKYSILFSGVLLPEFDTKRSLFCLLNTLKINKNTVRSIVLSKNKNIISGISADEANYFIDLFQESGLILYKRKELQPSINTIIINNDQQLKNLHISYINSHEEISIKKTSKEKTDDDKIEKNEIKNEIKEIKSKKSLLSRFYQPKIIIGSIFGFVASIIGLIAIFFPSLSNLGAKRINEFNMLINTDEDALQFYEFLKQNENKVVKLSLSYYVGDTYDAYTCILIDPETGSPLSIDNSNKFYNDIAWCRLSGQKELENKKFYDIKNQLRSNAINQSMAIELFWKNIKDYDLSKYIFTPFGKSLLFSAISKYDNPLHSNRVFRENGGLGFWLKSICKKSNDLLNPNVFAFQVAIPHKSNNNRLFQWWTNDLEKDRPVKIKEN